VERFAGCARRDFQVRASRDSSQNLSNNDSLLFVHIYIYKEVCPFYLGGVCSNYHNSMCSNYHNVECVYSCSSSAWNGCVHANLCIGTR